MSSARARLYLIPTPIAPDAIDTLSARSIVVLKSTQYFICERVRTTRRLLKSIDRTINIDELHFIEMDKHVDRINLTDLNPLTEGHNMAVISEAGMPCLADPGEKYVHAARKLNVEIKALSGPCSIIQALVASGFNAEQFKFHGYLSRDSGEIKKELTQLAQSLSKSAASQIWIETPYRNQQMIKACGQILPSGTLLCVAVDLDLDSEEVIVQSVKQWQSEDLSKWHKRPAIFIIGK